ncbi:response regulator [Desulfofundulus thermobenzoicus]|uniref:Stage 0 sporulation protein A homolog n=1 Tax=Desulfofundulus thermobenzoicus TaxID=29376 RepID=A0A6N7IV73_9FIRM|nr:sigma-54 dependent transcriptional regulator [Desulfofundulus thermobenzoicus]MQL53982.1 response regulator [Desulfofundulus thermobenzoicus]HHW44598.1 sigma-54-dependent Fis family transcriptional regulator [Desulfotomaculum sp.]
MVPRILIIDDEEHLCWALERALQQEGYHVHTATSGVKGLELIREKQPNLVILDLKMPEMDGLEVLKKAREIQPRMPVIMLTAHGTIETAIEAMKMGAADYLTKPFDLDELKLVIKQNLRVSQLTTEVNFLRSELTRKYTNMLVGNSPAIREVVSLIERVAASNATVLITGESGTGKEVTAVSIHQNSPRREGPFVAINCAALPEQLLESELFGHEKGAFTGATSRKLGRFELADRGTIFLDEIAEMPLPMQAKLLRVLQEMSFERIGGTETIRVDVRVIAATNRDLARAIEKGQFREDLYYRLNVFQIHMPPLRERKEDIPLLAEHFLQQFRPTYMVNKISPGAMELLSKYHWPGNIRELKNVIERAAIICQGEEILPDHLPKELLTPAREGSDLVVRFPDQGISLEQLEKELIVKALEKSGGNQTRAAQLLGITRSALLYRAQKYGINTS